jgi:hypothetical protein
MKKTSFRLHAPWEEVKELLKENDITLTDEDLKYEPGKEDELLQRLHKKMNKTPEEIKAYIESVSSNTGMAG